MKAMWSSPNRRGTRLDQTADNAVSRNGGANRGNGAASSNGASSGSSVSREEAGRLFSEAVARAMGLLARREHGRAELRSKLVAKGVDADVAAGVVEKLQAEGLQSEERFAAALVRRRIARGYGPVYIRGELRERRVDDEVADAELNRTDGFWLRLAEDALARKFPPHKGRDTPYNTRARFLARRGFPADTVYRALYAKPERQAGAPLKGRVRS